MTPFAFWNSLCPASLIFDSIFFVALSFVAAFLVSARSTSAALSGATYALHTQTRPLPPPPPGNGAVSHIARHLGGWGTQGPAPSPRTT